MSQTDSAFGPTAGLDVIPLRLADRVVENMVQAILDERLKPGEEMPAESKIAETFGVSKQVAREAVRQLSSIGLVHVQQGKISRVKALNSEPLDRFFGLVIRGNERRLRETNELRRVIETGAARLAAERRDPAGMIQLEAAIRQMEASLKDISGFTEADVAFHQAMAAATGNQMLALQVEGLRPVMLQVSVIFTSRRRRSVEDWKATYGRHLAIYEAISAGDLEATTRAVDIHFAAADLATTELFHDGAKE